MPHKKQIHTDRHRAFRALLVAERRAKGFTQTEIARRLGKPPSYVAKYELGERRLDVLEFLDLSEAIGFDASALLEKLGKTGR